MSVGIFCLFQVFFFSVDLLACEVVGCTNVVNFTDDNEDVFKD